MSVIDLKLVRAKELLETALEVMADALQKKEKGEPLEAGRCAARAARLAKDAVEVIESTVEPHN